MAQDERIELELLRGIERWTRLAALPGIRMLAEDLLDSDSKRRAYAAMDGATGLVAVEKSTGANHNDVSKWLKTWTAGGIIDPGVTPPRASFSLAELGIDTPPRKAVRTKKPAA